MGTNPFPFRHQQPHDTATQHITARVRHPVHEGQIVWNAGFTLGIKEELQIPHDATDRGQQAIEQQPPRWLG